MKVATLDNQTEIFFDLKHRSLRAEPIGTDEVVPIDFVVAPHIGNPIERAVKDYAKANDAQVKGKIIEPYQTELHESDAVY